jgi:transitional endoplasmic reticulum ATPase
LAHYIAREIEMPLMVRRASDIISPYVGETEQKIAQMFKQGQTGWCDVATRRGRQFSE